MAQMHKASSDGRSAGNRYEVFPSGTPADQKVGGSGPSERTRLIGPGLRKRGEGPLSFSDEVDFGSSHPLAVQRRDASGRWAE